MEVRKVNARFGPAGSALSFKQMGYRSSEQIPEYLSRFGLDAFEYQCGRGVRVNEEMAKQLKRNAEHYGIVLSLHAPYYISLSSVEQEKREKSIDYIVQSALAARWIGATRVTVHSGSCGKISRSEALELAKDTLKKALFALDEQGLGDIHLCPETMGKVNQLGTLEEVLELCLLDERLLPCVDFGHLNARTFGSIRSKEDYRAILDAIEDRLGNARLKCFHSHFSKIEYTQKGGEKAHLTFSDTDYGPDFEPLAELIAQKNLAPTFICESAGTQAEDAATMKQLYLSYKDA